MKNLFTLLSRYSMSRFASVLVIVLAAFSLMACQKQVEKKKPNVLFILADDLGYHDLSCMGSKYYETPNIDQIAKQGVVFTNGYAACQVCSPSRASIMSGKSPARHGITDWIGAKTGTDWRKHNRQNKLLPAEYVHQLSADYETLPEAMKAAGYKTFFAGKWHVGGEGSHPEDHGFDINKGGWDVGSPKGGFYAPYVNPKLKCGPDGESLTMRLAQETADFIATHKDTSFFAFLSFYAVHAPLQTTQEKWQKYRDKADSMGLAKSAFMMERRLPVRQVQDNPVYAGLVETMDDAVGLVLKQLKQLGLADNTIVIFTSDNGGVSSGDAFATSNLPLRGGKGYQWEGGIREPFLVHVPWFEQNGIHCDVPAIGTDFYPTILDLVGAELRPLEHADGVSLVPALQGKPMPERALFWHYPHYGNQGGDPSSIIRRGDWKLIRYYEDDRVELYNLVSDLSETADVSVDYPEKVDALKKELEDYLVSTQARYPEKDPEYSADKAEKRMEYIVNSVWPGKEKERLQLLSKDFNPKNNWWGSKVTND
jgi:arylsulfatase A-like enzyme